MKAEQKTDPASSTGPRPVASTPGLFAPVDQAIAAIRKGEMVIVVDDEDRENEGESDDRRGTRHARGDQLHGALRPRPDLHADDRQAAR